MLTDEAHRSQYDTLAMNMRTALPNAKFVAFTGTPLIAGEERTREVFGDYVSVYNFRQSVEDGATVPLFYENRTPELQITNPVLNEEIYQTIEDAGLDDDQEEKLQRVLGQRYHLITREDRLDAVAKDIVHHFLNRGYQGKAMVVSIDKLTTLRMYEKVRAEWEAEKARVLKAPEGMAGSHPDSATLHARLVNLQETDMAVVVSPGQNDGPETLPHRERMVKEDLEEKFKNPEDKFRLVFVCAMWLTGFDAPSCSTLYLDKPMRGHMLMQTIARANRVYGEKVNGLIVDYANVFQELEKALAIYSSGTERRRDAGEGQEGVGGSPANRTGSSGGVLPETERGSGGDSGFIQQAFHPGGQPTAADGRGVGFVPRPSERRGTALQGGDAGPGDSVVSAESAGDRRTSESGARRQGLGEYHGSDGRDLGRAG